MRNRFFATSIYATIRVAFVFAIVLSLTTGFKAAPSPWVQTDWVGGAGQTNWSDITRYDSATNIDTSNTGEATLSLTEELVNTGFESDLSSWSEVPSYILNDQFITPRAAGSVNGTAAEPTGGIRTVSDTTSKLNIGTGLLNFTGGTSSWGNPSLQYPSISRAAGKLVLVKLNLSTNTLQHATFGLFRNTTISPNNNLVSGFRFNSSGFIDVPGNATPGPNVASYSASTDYNFAIVMRGTGAFLFIKGGAFTNWTLLWTWTIDSTANVVPGLSSFDMPFTADNIRIPTAFWLPTPLAYDTFTRSDGSIGSSEIVGPDSQTTPSLAWTGGAISSNRNVITPVVGSELVTNGDMETGNPPDNWVAQSNVTLAQDFTTFNSGLASNLVTESGAANSYSGLEQTVSVNVGDWVNASIYWKANNGQIMNFMRNQNILGTTKSAASSASWTQSLLTGRVGSTPFKIEQAGQNGASPRTFNVDDASMKVLTLSSLFSSVSTSDSDVIVDAGVTLTAGTQAGVVTNLDSTSSPANFLIAYHDGTNVRLDKNVGGTYTNLISGAATYSAGATLRVITYTSGGSLKVRVYYNNALVGTEQTVSNAGIISNTNHGLFSTYSGNSFDNFTLWARGTGAEYSSAPFEELAATRDTTITYNSSAASARLVAGGTDANYLQSVNVGDTNTYNFTAYAYKGVGQAVTTDDVNLYYDGAVLTTAVASVGNDWYRLSGTLTGANASRDYGVRVKAGKTVYVDDFSLNRYEPSGTLTSSIFDSDYGSNWGTLTYTATTPASTGVEVRIRTSNDSDMSSAPAFSSCVAISSGSDISSNNCVTDDQRYVQYQLTLITADSIETPTFSDISLDFVVSDVAAPLVTLTPLTPDPTTDTTPTISGTATESVGTVASVEFQMDGTGGAWSACTATDGIFDEQVEDFTCTVVSALVDGVHTMYVRATDLFGNTTLPGAESTDTFTVDTTAPTGLALINPAEKSYTNKARPNYTWQVAADTGSPMQSYQLTVNNGTESFQISGIPATHAGVYDTPTYSVFYVDNQLILVTKSSATWGAGENDGKIKEGIRTWEVTAYDTAGNTQQRSGSVFVDFTAPSIDIETIADLWYTDPFTTAETKPAITGVITDNLAGTQGDASGPDLVSFSFVSDGQVVLANYIDFHDLYWTDTKTLIGDGNTQQAGKYSPYKLIPTTDLPADDYTVTLTATDIAGNTSQKQFMLIINKEMDIEVIEEVEPEEEQETDTVEPGDSDKIKITIRVIDSDNMPIEGAQVGLFSDPKSGITNEQGEVVFDGVERGEHNVVVTYDEQTGQQKIDADDDTKVEYVYTIKLFPSSPFANGWVILVIIILILVAIIFYFLWRKNARLMNGN